ncbi:MAG: TetR/AcrR family transcriptional regulator [Erysipelothrix sp.]
MKTGPKGFSDEEKNLLRELLISNCIASWTKKGYTKTSIAKITSDAHIATGSFYLLFDNKEELFYESFLAIQNTLMHRSNQITSTKPNIEGFIELNMMLFEEYAAKPFLYSFNNHDFELFLSKLEPHQVDILFESNISSFEESLRACGLKSIVSDLFTFDTLNTLLSTIKSGHETTIPKIEIYEILLRSVLPNIINEK